MASNKIVRAAVVLAFLTPLVMPLHGSVARAVAFDEKVQAADSIVLGRCTGTRSAWDATGRWILTYSTFRVERAWKGAAVPELTVITPGGTVGSLHQETVGVPRFAMGGQNVVFVKQGSIGPTVLYMDQGAYRVEADDRGELTVQPVFSSLVLVDSQTGQVSPAEQARPLRQFEREVREAVARGERGRIQRYDVAPAKEQPKSALSQLRDLINQNRILIGLALVAFAITTYLLMRGR